MRLLIAALLTTLVLTACGSRPVHVEYNPDAVSPGGDWFPVPTESSVTVTSADRLVERPPVRIDEGLVTNQTAPLEVEQKVDSFGNLSLEVNRGADLTWELLNAAVNRLGWSVADRNRTEYRLRLADRDQASRGFFAGLKAFFTEEDQAVSLILVPKVSATGISAEYPDDKALSVEDNRRLMTQLREALLQGQ